MQLAWQGELVRIRPFKSQGELLKLLDELHMEKDEFWGRTWWVRQRVRESFEKHGRISHAIGWSTFAVDRLDSGELVGYEVMQLPKPVQIDAKIGTFISRKHWSCGFGREAKRLATCVLFESFPLERVSSVTLENHARARDGLIACGFELEGICQRSVFSMGKWAGIAKYVIFREQWEKLPIRQIVRRGVA